MLPRLELKSKSVAIYTADVPKASYRPKIRIPFDFYDHFLIWASLIFTAIHLFYLLQNPVPEGMQVPMKFDWSGQAISYGSPRSVWLLFWATLILVLPVNILACFPWLHNFPWKITDQNAEELYRLSRRLCLFISFWLSLLFLICTVILIKITLMPQMLFPGYLVVLFASGPVISTALFFARGSRIAKS